MKPTNFHFLQAEWPDIFEEAKEAESLTYASPKAACIVARSALEKTVRWLFQNDESLAFPYDDRLSALMHEPAFQNSLKPSLWREINLIRKIGNNAAHGTKIKQEEALICLKNLFRFEAYLALYYGESEIKAPTFDLALVPESNLQKESAKQLNALDEKLEKENESLRRELQQLREKAVEDEDLRANLAAAQARIRDRKVKREAEIDFEAAIPLLVSEAKTRQLYIDQDLASAGWKDLKQDYHLEYEVKGMPKSTNPSGIGYVDYVLWGDDGLPLAVVEAKKTMKNPKSGMQQAWLYANCLEEMHGRRPLIFYTNGFDTYLWDDQFYPERKVASFFTKDELKLVIDRRKSRKDLRKFTPDPDIAGRPYQLEAIQRVAETFCTTHQGALSGKQRKALLVMATGSGKTRTAISLVDMLTKSNWVKRVLFLADRNALLRQAKRAFNDNLPELSAIDLTQEKEDEGTRLVFSTYPTIINKIDAVKTEDERFYGPGHFDLVIIDEAHRSVYQKYRAIFNYFDSLLIGLTATPKKEIDRNTYDLFEIEDDNPTFSYELPQAVSDEYLVPFKKVIVPMKFPSEGINYHELTAEEQAEYEELFGDPTTETSDRIGSNAINKWLFNKDTVDKALRFFMEKSLKVEGGDKIGKSIIFAKNHHHALFIEERFNKLYPQYKGGFLRIIDNYESKADDLIQRFCDEYKVQYPQVAVSVDMMDTGVDAPSVVNLMFFKQVKSLSKFWQMIGRGTRLRPDLFAPGEDKKHFLIFDFCQNFEFFGENPEGIEGAVIKSLSHRIFELKLDIALILRRQDEINDDDLETAEQYLKSLYHEVKGFNRERFMVREHLKQVVKYSEAQAWQNLNDEDALEIKKHLALLAEPDINDDESARRFDLLVLLLIFSHILEKSTGSYINRIRTSAKGLLKKRNIPQIANQENLLLHLSEDEYWSNISPKKLEKVRNEIRDLIKFLDKDKQVNVYTNFKDDLDKDSVVEEDFDVDAFGKQSKPYKERVESYLRKHKDHLVIHKLRMNQAITCEELKQLEDFLFSEESGAKRDDFAKHYEDEPLGLFVRKIVGLDKAAANQAFADFIQSGDWNANQINFINQVVDFLTDNGHIDAEMLFESPFTEYHEYGLGGIFEDGEAHKVISIINKLDENAEGVA